MPRDKKGITKSKLKEMLKGLPEHDASSRWIEDARRLQETIGPNLRNLNPSVNRNIAKDLSNLVTRQTREEAERTQREKDLLGEMRAIRKELQHEREARERLEHQVADHDRELSRYRTGAPGRPGSSHLIVEEFHRRRSSGQVEATLKQQADCLIEWLHQTHPEAVQLRPKTAQNVIRTLFRKAREADRSSKKPQKE